MIYGRREPLAVDFIQMEMNQKMEPLYKAAVLDYVGDRDSATATLAEMIGLEVERVEDANLLVGLEEKSKVNVTDFPNLTEYECVVNSFRVQDYIENISEVEAIGEAYEYALSLSEKLKSTASRRQFRSMINSNHSGCFFRFHEIREGEPWGGSKGDDALLSMESGDFIERDGQTGLVTIARFRDMPEALVAKTKLESAGIECTLSDDNMVRINWFYSSAIGGMRLQVKQEDAEDAVEVLESGNTESTAEEADIPEPK